MGQPVLLLRLEGPLQSWGTRSCWDVRDSAHEPTKSGVIGLLGCAMGLARVDATLLELDRSLRFGVRVESAGRMVTDYQTITDYLPTAGGSFKLSGSKTVSTLESARKSGEPATIISPRDYLEDAAFLVGFEARDEMGNALLEGAAAALQSPRWPLFLGRKCCVPTRPVFESFGSDFDDLQSALRLYRWEVGAAGASVRDAPTRPLSAWIESDDANAKGAVARQDALRLNAARVYDFRFARPLDGVAPTNLNEVQP